MKSSIRQFNPKLIIIALTATIATVAQPQPASAQILEIVSGALGALVRSKQPQPQVITQVVQHSPIAPQSPIAQQQTSSTVVNQNGVVNGTATAQTNQQSSSQSAIQNIPNHPTTNIPPVNLPINLPR